jgi:uncharacterized protein (DUF1697 family)
LSRAPLTRYVCLLRGVNVGGKNRLAMPTLKELFEDLGFDRVTTYIQSGNVVFSARDRPDAGELEAAIAGKFALSVQAVLRSAADLRRVVRTNPFVHEVPESLHVGFFVERPSKALVGGLDPEAHAPDRFVVRGDEVFLHLPSGMARTKVVGYLGRRLGASTIRNWNSVTALARLTARTGADVDVPVARGRPRPK